MLTVNGLLKAAREDGGVAKYLGGEIASKGGRVVPVAEPGTSLVALRMASVSLEAKGMKAVGVRTPFGLIPTVFTPWGDHHLYSGDGSTKQFHQVDGYATPGTSPEEWVYVYYSGAGGVRQVCLKHGSAERGHVLPVRLSRFDSSEHLEHIVVKPVKRWSLLDANEGNGKDNLRIGSSVPGVVYLSVSFGTLGSLILNHGEPMARLIRAVMSTAINAAKRSPKTKAGVLFGADPNEGRKKVLLSRVTHYTDRGQCLLAEIRNSEATLKRARLRLKEAKPLKTKVFDTLDECVKSGELDGWKVDRRYFWLLFPKLRVECVADSWNGMEYTAGLYELPKAVVRIPISGEIKSALKVYDEKGEIYPHPHVQRGSAGTPCWGETTDKAAENAELLQDLWDGEPEQFVYFMTSLFCQMYGEGKGGNGQYTPFQYWGVRVGDQTTDAGGVTA